jgi:exodeoxyribonuclease VII small subunit
VFPLAGRLARPAPDARGDCGKAATSPLDHAGAPVQTRAMDSPDLAALSFEDALKRLEAIVQRLESGDASLEDSITLYTEGQTLKAHCDAKLKDATMRIEAIQQNDAGDAIGTRPFDAPGGTPPQ